MGLLDGLLGFGLQEQTQQQQNMRWLDYQFLAAQRMGYDFEPIDWPKIIANQCRALALTRPLTQVEQFTYDGALQALNGEENLCGDTSTVEDSGKS